jgi:hypothetical protein
MKPIIMRASLLARLSAAAGIAVLLIAAPALGKEGASARLTTPLPSDAPPGQTIRIAWTLGYPDGSGHTRPFNAEGIFVRLLSASGGEPSTAYARSGAHPRGRYFANATVPDGGIRGIQIGIRGTTEVLFPLANDPFDGSGSAPASDPGGGGPLGSWLVPALAFAALAAFAAAGIFRRRRHAL